MTCRNGVIADGLVSRLKDKAACCLMLAGWSLLWIGGAASYAAMAGADPSWNWSGVGGSP